MKFTDVLKFAYQKDEEVEYYRSKFAGSQADRIERAGAEAGKLADELKKTKVSGYISLFMVEDLLLMVRDNY